MSILSFNSSKVSAFHFLIEEKLCTSEDKIALQWMPTAPSETIETHIRRYWSSVAEIHSPEEWQSFLSTHEPTVMAYVFEDSPIQRKLFNVLSAKNKIDAYFAITKDHSVLNFKSEEGSSHPFLTKSRAYSVDDVDQPKTHLPFALRSRYIIYRSFAPPTEFKLDEYAASWDEKFPAEAEKSSLAEDTDSFDGLANQEARKKQLDRFEWCFNLWLKENSEQLTVEVDESNLNEFIQMGIPLAIVWINYAHSWSKHRWIQLHQELAAHFPVGLFNFVFANGVSPRADRTIESLGGKKHNPSNSQMSGKERFLFPIFMILDLNVERPSSFIFSPSSSDVSVLTSNIRPLKKELEVWYQSFMEGILEPTAVL